MSKIAIVIRGSWWMKITMVNSGLKGFKQNTHLFSFTPIVSRPIPVVQGSRPTAIITLTNTRHPIDKIGKK